jgi:hypothetical protein
VQPGHCCLCPSYGTLAALPCRNEGPGDGRVRRHHHCGIGAPAEGRLCKPRRQLSSVVQVRLTCTWPATAAAAAGVAHNCEPKNAAAVMLLRMIVGSSLHLSAAHHCM